MSNFGATFCVNKSRSALKLGNFIATRSATLINHVVSFFVWRGENLTEPFKVWKEMSSPQLQVGKLVAASCVDHFEALAPDSRGVQSPSPSHSSSTPAHSGVELDLCSATPPFEPTGRDNKSYLWNRKAKIGFTSVGHYLVLKHIPHFCWNPDCC